MGRAVRLHHPGSAFHIVARTQGRETWFVDELKDRIADMLLTGVASAGARLLAFAVMDNHFHVILFQGRAPLGEIMQPPLRRIALLIQKTQRRNGHVFERRYRAKLCHDAEHLPNAILYVHRNPVAAKICARAADYRWSSASVYEGNCPPGFVSVADGLRAFDSASSASVSSLRNVYQDRLSRHSDEELDQYWSWFCRTLRRQRQSGARPYVPLSPHIDRPALRDLRDVALRALHSIDDSVDSEIVRSRYGGRQIVAIRAKLIAALVQRGYPGIDIARYLRISEATVSRVRSALRWSTLTQISEADELEDGRQVR